MVVRYSIPGGSHALSAECKLRRPSTLHRALLASCRGNFYGEGKFSYLAYTTVLEPASNVRYIHTHTFRNCVFVGLLCRSHVNIYHFFSSSACFRERVAPQKAGKTPLDMDQFRMLFCTCKVPGVKKDTIHNYFKTGRINSTVYPLGTRVYNLAHTAYHCYVTCILCFAAECEGPCPSHVVVMCRGRIFTFDALCDGEILTPPELLRYFLFASKHTC